MDYSQTHFVTSTPVVELPEVADAYFLSTGDYMTEWAALKWGVRIVQTPEASVILTVSDGALARAKADVAASRSFTDISGRFRSEPDLSSSR